MSQKETCPKCGKKNYRIMALSVFIKIFLVKEVECSGCHFKWILNQYLCDPRNEHRYIQPHKEKLIQLHRWIWEYFNRKLESWEVIHHKNGKKGDNRYNNLVLMTTYSHARLERQKRGIGKGG